MKLQRILYNLNTLLKNTINTTFINRNVNTLSISQIFKIDKSNLFDRINLI